MCVCPISFGVGEHWCRWTIMFIQVIQWTNLKFHKTHWKRSRQSLMEPADGKKRYLCSNQFESLHSERKGLDMGSNADNGLSVRCSLRYGFIWGSDQSDWHWHLLMPQESDRRKSEGKSWTTRVRQREMRMKREGMRSQCETVTGEVTSMWLLTGWATGLSVRKVFKMMSVQPWGSGSRNI